MRKTLLPAVLAHADWSIDPDKRWVARGRLEGAAYRLHAPEPVGELDSFLSRLRHSAAPGACIVGFDFPLGIPVAYARLCSIDSFLDALPRFGTGQWSHFYDLARVPAEVSVQRPFYPFKPGGTSPAQLVEALRVNGMDELLRVCDRATPRRRAANPLFWTLGPKQVGRAAIVGWRDVIAPALQDRDLRVSLWPFQGALDELVHASSCVVVETYPAEGCLHLGMTAPGNGWKKGCQEDRRQQGRLLLDWAQSRGVTLSDRLTCGVLAGFGADRTAEDRFDAVVGLMSMVEVLLGYRTDGRPSDPTTCGVEGWIFGQTPTTSDGLASSSLRRERWT
jgi:hypothetical protein